MKHILLLTVLVVGLEARASEQVNHAEILKRVPEAFLAHVGGAMPDRREIETHCLECYSDRHTGETMALSMKECEVSALRLPIAERAALAERLIQSLDSPDDAETERLWVDEAERRYQAYKQGSLSARSADGAIQDARARFR